MWLFCYSKSKLHIYYGIDFTCTLFTPEFIRCKCIVQRDSFSRDLWVHSQSLHWWVVMKRGVVWPTGQTTPTRCTSMHVSVHSCIQIVNLSVNLSLRLFYCSTCYAITYKSLYTDYSCMMFCACVSWCFDICVMFDICVIFVFWFF